MIGEIKTHLTERIIPFWKKLKDEKHGGFYGYVDYDLKMDQKAPKGVILNSRILWFFANSYSLLKNEDDLLFAKHSYEFLVDKCMDHEYGGVYWMLSAEGEPVEDMKHTYNQAFAIYALASYYEASKDEAALCKALDLFELIESKCKDAFGYIEAFDRKWHAIDNNKLSDNKHLSAEGVTAEKTMNTLLHVLEAYTELYRVSHHAAVGDKLYELLELFEQKVYNPQADILEVFFDYQLNSISDMHSYGHDIEAAWLLDRACEVLGNEDMIKRTYAYTVKLAYKVSGSAFENGALNNERFKSYIDRTRIWWVQAEGIVGFINAYEKSGDSGFLGHANALWEYIKDYIMDKRVEGEWVWSVDFDGNPASGQPIVEPWKCPYHNGRMCFEVIRRNVDVRGKLYERIS